MTFEPGELGQSKADLAETLRTLRKRASRTQIWLARRVNMSQTKISNIEGGKITPSLVDVELLLRALNAPPALAARVAVLHDAAKRFTFILTEQAVRWPYLQGSAMAMQIDHLASVSRLPSVRLGVIPLEGHMPVAPLNTFTIYDARISTVETSTGAMVFRDHRDVSAYLNEFAVYEGYASFGEEAGELLATWGDQYRS